MTIQQRIQGALARKFSLSVEQADALIEAGLHTVKLARKASKAELEKAGIPIEKVKGK